MRFHGVRTGHREPWASKTNSPTNSGAGTPLRQGSGQALQTAGRLPALQRTVLWADFATPSRPKRLKALC